VPAQTSSVRLTWEDYLLFPDDGRRYEIIAGECFGTPAPDVRHQLVSGNLQGALWSFLQQHRLGTVLAAPSDVVLDESDIVQPDLLFVSRERESILAETGTRGAPDLVVEILSESTRRTDEKIKRALYAKAGVREYWIADPELDRIQVYRPSGSALELVAELDLERGDTLRTPLLPGFELPLARIFPAR
jgi:Uma2 family endonuclease